MLEGNLTPRLLKSSMGSFKRYHRRTCWWWQTKGKSSKFSFNVLISECSHISLSALGTHLVAVIFFLKFTVRFSVSGKCTNEWQLSHDHSKRHWEAQANEHWYLGKNLAFFSTLLILCLFLCFTTWPASFICNIYFDQKRKQGTWFFSFLGPGKKWNRKNYKLGEHKIHFYLTQKLRAHLIGCCDVLFMLCHFIQY